MSLENSLENSFDHSLEYTHRKAKKKFSKLVLLVLPLLLVGSSVIAQSDKNAIFLYKKGEEALGQRDYRVALDYSRRALEKNPGYLEAVLLAGQAYYGLGDFNRSKDTFTSVLKRDASNKVARTYVGLSEIQLGNYSNAKGHLEKVRNQDPGNVANNLALGSLYMKLNRTDIAEAYYEKALRRNPSSISALLGMAEVNYHKKKYERAFGYIDKAKSIDSTSPDSYDKEGQLYLLRASMSDNAMTKAEYYSKAHSAYETALELSPRNAQVERKIALLDFFRGKFEDSADRFKTLTSHDPDDVQARYTYALAEHRLGRTNVGSFYRSLQVEPADSVIRFSLEQKLLDKGQTGEVEVRRKLASYHLKLYDYYESANAVDRMRGHLNRALLLQPGNRRALQERLEIARRENNVEEFIRLLQSLRQANPNDSSVQFRLEETLRNKNKYLPYRENLLSPSIDPANATFQRTPKRVFFFDFSSLEAFPLHPDLGQLLPVAMAGHLNDGGSAATFGPAFRQEALESIRQIKNLPSLFGVPYQADYLSVLEDLSPEKMTLVVAGSFRSNSNSLEANIQIMDPLTGRTVDQFRMTAKGEDAIHEVSRLAVLKIKAHLKPEGRVIKVRPKEIYVNLGSIDGVTTKTELRISGAETDRGECKVTEVSTYVSKCTPKADWVKYHEQDRVVILPKK